MEGIKCEAKTVATNSPSLFLSFLHYSNEGSILICTVTVQEVRYYVSEEESKVKIQSQVSSIYRCYLIPWDWVRLPRERGREGSQIKTENLQYLEVVWRKEIPPIKQEDTVSENFRSPICPVEYPFEYLLFIIYSLILVFSFLLLVIHILGQILIFETGNHVAGVSVFQYCKKWILCPPKGNMGYIK